MTMMHLVMNRRNATTRALLGVLIEELIRCCDIFLTGDVRIFATEFPQVDLFDDLTVHNGVMQRNQKDDGARMNTIFTETPVWIQNRTVEGAHVGVVG